MQKYFKHVSIVLFLLILTVGCSSNQDSKKDEPQTTEGNSNGELIISAAASLKDALEEIKDMYKNERPEITLNFNFGGSGSLQQQISQGAPADLFFSAAEDKFDLLIEEGVIAKDDRVNLLGNELVLIVSEGNQSINGFEDLAIVEIDNISIGTPETVPAGKYAKESLEEMGIWEAVEQKIVYAKDVRQVLSYVDTRNIDAGIVYKTDALISEKIEVIATADPSTHDSIIYPVGVIKDSKNYNAAKDFFEYLQSADALKVFDKYGFTAN